MNLHKPKSDTSRNLKKNKELMKFTEKKEMIREKQ